MKRDLFGFDVHGDDDEELENALAELADELEEEGPDAAQVYLAGTEQPDTRPRCTVPGCHGLAPEVCVFALHGRKAGQFCARRLCRAHAGEARICPAHARLTGAVTP